MAGEPAPSYRALQARCDEVSSSVLWQRVGELRDAGLVEAVDGGGLRLSDEGRRLGDLLLPLHRFAEEWAER